ncbi:hypothetical protein BGX28_003166 [Mortierella sp. GBA30]|nr:hypothetical protein BGX28_003166 [Mortierella sp. GBA30]
MSAWGDPASGSQTTQQWGSNDDYTSSSSNAPQSNGGQSNSWGASTSTAESSGGWGASASVSNDNWSSMEQMESTLISDDQHQKNDDFQPHRTFSDAAPPVEVPEPTVSIEEAWPEFLEADKTRDLDEVKPALAKMCAAFLGSDWQEMEQKFRDEKCNTYLLALDDKVSFGYTLVNLKMEPNQRYRVIPSFIKPGTVKKGRMSIGMASNYDENFARLADGGVVRPSGALRCFNCKQEGHVSSECPEEKHQPERSEYFGKCYNCGSEEHRTRNCPAPRQMMTCRNCNKEGHMARDCAEPPVCNRCGEEGHGIRDCDQPRTDITCNRCQQMGHMARDCPEPRTDITCNRCNQPGHMIRDCPEPRTDITCNRCNEVGHMARDCLQPREVTCNRCGETGHMSRDCGQPRTDITCFNCDQTGHLSRDCGQPRKEKCFKCGESGHKSFDCTNEANGNYVERERRPPPSRADRWGFQSGF